MFVLASASLAAAWGGYQSARWGGVQSTLYSQAGAMRVESTRSQTQSQLLAITDHTILNECAEAFPTRGETVRAFAGATHQASQRTELDACYEEQFSPELRAAMEAWFDTMPSDLDPQSGPSQIDAFVRREAVESKQLESRASQLFTDGQAANQQSDDYVLTTVFLATVMFFGGLSSQMTWRPMRIGFLGFAAVLLGFSLWRLWTFPVM